MSKIQVIIHSTSPSSSQPECSICFSDIEQETKLQECKHSFCKDCLQEYLRTEINSLNVLKIKCPEQRCSHVLTSSSLEKLLNSTDFERYQKLLLQKMAHKNKETICPQPGCSKIVTPRTNSPSTQCGCGAVICNLCGSLEHQGKTCIAALDPEFEIYASENNLKMCLMCKTMVTRVAGCLHIECPICDYDWCWVCGREYTHSHEAKCPKIWSPLPPKKIVKESEKQGICKKLMTCVFSVIKFIFYLIMLQLFFPYVVLNIHQEFTRPTRTRKDNIILISLLTVVQIIYFGGFVALTFLMKIYPESTLPFIVSMAIIGAAPWITKFILLIIIQKQSEKRWMSRNSKIFHYTPANKPTQDLENANGAQAQTTDDLGRQSQDIVEINSPKTEDFDRQSPTETYPLNA